MDEADIRFFAYVQSLVAEMSAINASVAGMQAANATRAANGEAAAYPDRNFGEAADQLDAIAEKLREA